MRIAVIVCTHNPKPRFFNRVLDGLQSQSLDVGAWSLTVVDNRSDPAVEPEIDLKWHPAAQVVREDNLGLTHARARGFRSTTSDLILMVDDDNVLHSDYLARTLSIASKHPNLGAFGGSIVGSFESDPPTWFSQFEFDLIGVRPVAEDHWSNSRWDWNAMPIGAGMVIRREVADAYLGLIKSDTVRSDLDRKGKSLVSAGDSDITQTACRIGLGIGRFAELRLEHLIPVERLRLDYLVRIAEAIGFSQAILERLDGSVPEKNHGRPIGRALHHLLRRYGELRRERHQRIVRAAFTRGHNRGEKVDLTSLSAQS